MNFIVFILEFLTINKFLHNCLTDICKFYIIKEKKLRGIMKDHLKDLYEYLLEKKCKDVLVYDLSTEGQSYDYVYIATIKDAQQNKKLALEIMQDFEIESYPEGYYKGEWIIFDFNQCVLHLFVASARDKYNLDKLWQSKKIKM